MMWTALLSLTLSTTVSALIGLDSESPLSVEAFQCLKQNGTYDFFIGQVWEADGIYDNQGMQNMKNAKAAGITYVDGYMLPCTKTDCAHPANQIEAVINKVRSNGTPMDTLWLEIVRLNWNYWPHDKNTNRNFIAAMAQQAESMGVSLGINTDYGGWEAIVGLDWTEMSKYPLWWTDWTGKQDFSGFKPFGGWTKPDIHQYAEDVAGVCGVVTISQNWLPDLNNGRIAH